MVDGGEPGGEFFGVGGEHFELDAHEEAVLVTVDVLVELDNIVVVGLEPGCDVVYESDAVGAGNGEDVQHFGWRGLTWNRGFGAGSRVRFIGLNLC